MFRATRSTAGSRQIITILTTSSVFRAPGQPPTRSALLTPNWRGCEGTSYYLFSNIKAWLVGTHHGVSAKHLPRYLREWSYRFNRRNLPDELDGYLIRRAVECATITYDQLKAGTLPDGAKRIRRPRAAVAQPALA
jgi:hypothetical protein